MGRYKIHESAYHYSMGEGSYRGAYFEEDIKKAYRAGYEQALKDAEAGKGEEPDSWTPEVREWCAKVGKEMKAEMDALVKPTLCEERGFHAGFKLEKDRWTRIEQATCLYCNKYLFSGGTKNYPRGETVDEKLGI